MNKIKSALKLGSALVTVLMVSPTLALAQDVDLTKISDQYKDLSNVNAQGVLSFVINGLLIVAGLIAFLFLLWGGVQWILAGGDKEGTEKARKRITNALVGLAIVFSAYALAYLVNAVFSVNILQFNIPKIVG
ncbi:MAG: hypothetical protein Q7S31_02795 [bacterium]|nr:hypothetical protein [bacterium]